MKIKINKKTNITLTLFFFAIFFIFSFQISQEKTVEKKYEKIEFTKEISGKAYVSDGDTIKFGKNRIRLLFIDTPETKQECFNKNNQKYRCGIMAKNFLIKLINDQEVTCKYNRKDIYQRYLAECFIGEISINKAMIENGMAVVFSYTEFDPELKALQEKAKKEKLGIWQGEFELPKDYRKRIRDSKP